MVQPATSLVGQLVGGRFRVLHAIAAGGMGAVYEARDELLGRRVALKVIRGELIGDPVARARFKREALATAAVAHPGLVTLHDLSLDGDPAFFVMELIEGRTLDALLHDEGRLHWPRALRLVVDLLDALEALHAQGIVHRDVKPSNLMVVGGAERERCRLIDLGVARLLTAPADDARTASGVAVGTPAYMAPEQLAGERVGPAADLYAVGLVAFKALTGLHPFSTARSDDVTGDGRAAPPPTVQTFAPDVPVEVSRVVDRLLHRAPMRRPRAASEVAEELRRVLRGASSGGPVATARPASTSTDSQPGASEPAYRPSPPPERTVSTVAAPSARGADGARRVPPSMAIGAVGLAAVCGVALWIGLASGAPAAQPTPGSGVPPTVPPSAGAIVPELPRGALPPEPTPTHADPAREVRSASARVVPEADEQRATAPPTIDTDGPTPVEPELPRSTAEPPSSTQPPTTSATPLPSTPGQRPASRLSIQYVGPAGRSDQAAVAGVLDPRIRACIDPSRHYANRMIAMVALSIEQDGSVSSSEPATWDATPEERRCVEAAIRDAPWPAGTRRRTHVRINPLL